MIGRLKPPAWARTAVATCPLLQSIVADGMHGYRDSQQVLVSIRSATVVGEAAEVDKNKRECDSEDSRSWTRNRLLYLGRLSRAISFDGFWGDMIVAQKDGQRRRGSCVISVG